MTDSEPQTIINDAAGLPYLVAAAGQASGVLEDNMGHSPEPWHSTSNSVFGSAEHMPGASGHIAHCSRIDGLQEKAAFGVAEANARRIAACVNALVDFTTEELEHADFRIWSTL